MGDRLEEIRERASAAIPGPWAMTDGWGPASDGTMRFARIVDGDFRSVVETEPGLDLAARREDAEFIALAPVDIPFLLGEVTRLQQKLDAAIAAALDTQRRLDTELLETREQAETGHARLEAAAELVQQWRAKGAQADFLGVVNVWDEAADQLAVALAKQ